MLCRDIQVGQDTPDLGSRENISTGQIMLFCSYGEMFSRLPGKVSRGDVDFVNLQLLL